MRKKELFLTLLIGCLCLGGCSQAVQSQETNKMSYAELEQKYEKLLKENEELKNEKKNEYGIVSGTITYLDTEADTGAVVVLIPSDGSVENEDIKIQPGYLINSVENIKCLNMGKVSGNGDFNINHVAEGEYLAFIVSNNTSAESWFESEENYYKEIAENFNGILSDSSASNLSEAVAFYKYHIATVTVYAEETTTINYDFGMSYTQV